MYKLKIIVFLLPFSMLSQNIKGRVYDNESTAKGIEIINITQSIKTFTDENGDFEIKASVNDSLTFESLFHHKKFLKVSKEHFNYKLVVGLNKKVNELGEVLLSDDKQKTFDPIEYTQEFSFGLAEDMKMNPHLYKPTPTGGFNVFAVAMEIVKLLKKKKSEVAPIKTISYKTMDSLFSKDKFFNKKMLKDDLHITDELKPLFFDYCDAQHLDSKLLEKDNQFFLLDSLINYSTDFKTILNQQKKD